jgi:DNA-binding transcriptional regulator GbsR (MarR family)
MSNLAKTMDTIADLHKSHGVKQKGGKLYTQVVHRMEAFRRIHGTDFGLDTEILVNDGQKVVIKAIITDKDGRKVGAGMAEEIRGQGLVNTTSALENAETSAIGRALASLGLAGGEYASANELDAVERKTQAMKEEPNKDVSPVKEAPRSLQIKPPQLTPEERRKRHEEKLEDFEHWCKQKKTQKQLDDYFEESKSTLNEIQKHNPDLYKEGKEIFLKYLEIMEGKRNG